ncbi:hypothetical protein [Streptomyces sp. NPDC005096]|uniref:hypothetical protein n=1 Tax=Streptomyces sp. NPDC005096 TaxID=3154559 RepID=UPI0033B8AB99
MRFGTGGIEKIDRVMVLDIRSRRSPRGRTLSDDRCAQRLEKTLEGQVADAAKGNHGGRPKVIGDDMLTVAVALGDKGVPVPEIAKKLVIRTGKNAGKNPSVASLHRALAEAEDAADDGLPLRPAQARPHPPARSPAHPRGDRPPRTSPGPASPEHGDPPLEPVINLSANGCTDVPRGRRQSHLDGAG